MSRKGINSKEKNGNWKGENCTLQNGRTRASHWFEVKECEICGQNAIERHHRDNNPLNNIPENIQPLCRRCHMEIDGRMQKLILCKKPQIRGQKGRFVSIKNAN